MEIKDLQPRQGKVDVVVEVFEKGDTREFEKFGRKGKVCSAKAKDATGEIILSLWNEQIDQVNAGDTVHISNGYVSEFQGEKQLTTGKFGKLEIIKKSVAANNEETTVFTNAPPEEFKKEMKDLSDEEMPNEELSDEDLSEDPVDDEEYIG
jgi:ssDNA-binding replication factor A large subunit